MNPLQSRLAALRRRLRLIVVWRGFTGVALVLVTCGVAAGLLDWELHLPGLVRGVLLVGSLAAAAAVGWRYLLEPLAANADDLALALKVEEHYPILNDSLASTVEFLGQQGGQSQSDSPALRREAIKRGLRLADACNFNDVIDARGTYWTSCAALVSVTLAVSLFLFFPGLAETALIRFLEPFGSHSWTRLELEGCPARVAAGVPFNIKGTVAGIIPLDVRIEVQNRMIEDGDDWRPADRLVVPIKRDAEAGTAAFDAALDMTQQRSKFRFRLQAYDALYPARGWREVEVVPPPQLALLDGLPSPQIDLYFPAYTDLPSPEKLSPGVQHIEAVAGTLVKLRAAVDRPIASAWIDYRPDNPPAKLALAVAPLGFAAALPHFAVTVGGHAVWGTIPAQLDADGMRLAVDFMPWAAGLYALHLQDADGLFRTYEWRLSVLADPVPVVTLERPAGNQDVLPDAEIGLRASVADDKYAVRSVFLEYRVKDVAGKWLDNEPRRLPLWGGPVQNAVAPSSKRQRVDINTRWPIRGLAESGQVLVMQVCADDFNNVVAFPRAGRSSEVELRLVTRSELAKKIDESLQQMQQDLVRVQQMQKEALDRVKEIQEKKVSARLSQELVEVEERQKQVQARVGANSDDGLRGDVKRMQQVLRDNKMPPADVDQRLRTLDLELERITQEDLQQIEPNLVQARKEAGEQEPAAADKPAPAGDKANSKRKSALDKARKHQENAKESLDELVKFMAPWADLQQVKGAARTLQQKQRDLKKSTDALADKRLPDKGPDAQKAHEEIRKELGKLTDAQNDLANEADELLKMMEKVQGKQAEKGDAKTAELLKEAQDVAGKGLLPEKLREAGDLMREQKPNAASVKQQEGIENLEKVIGTLEERRDEQIAKLLDKQRQEEDKLDKLKDDQDRLQKKVRQEKKAVDELAKKQKQVEDRLAKKEGDQGKLKAEREDLQKQIDEHKRELERLAQEQRKLQKDVKDEARELARLQAERASKELDRAGEALERAADLLENGEAPEEAMQEAMERLDKAQAKLQEAQEELAREQLARIADHLKGLHERQDRVTAESARIHQQAIEKRKHWTDPLLASLKANARAQKNIGQETESLKDKLKGARVFEHVLIKAARAMDDAGKIMEERFVKGQERLDTLDKEALADEMNTQQETMRVQEEAGKRLNRLLEAIKDDPVAKRPSRKKDKEEEQAKKEQDKGGIRPGDGIADVAQLKVLRDEQRDLLDRTREFARRHPSWPSVDERLKDRLPELQAEMADLQADQAAIQRLFEEISRPVEKKGDNP